MTLLLGVDPGACGAAALVEWPSRRLVRWWVWTTLERRGGEAVRLTTHPAFLYPLDVRGMPGVAGEILDDLAGLEGPGLVLSVEGLFSCGQLCIPLAEATGELIGPLRSLTTQPIRRPLSREWRPRILGIPATTKKEPAEAAAVRWAEGLGLLGAEHAALTKAERGALAEACAIALWGAL